MTAGRLRVSKIEADLDPNLNPDGGGNASHCFDIFRDYCVITESVRSGIEVAVDVRMPVYTEPELASR